VKSRVVVLTLKKICVHGPGVSSAAGRADEAQGDVSTKRDLRGSRDEEVSNVLPKFGIECLERRVSSRANKAKRKKVCEVRRRRSVGL
jgi:hypothetical protein